MKKFLEDLKNALTKMKVSEDKITDILSDMQEMIQAAKEEGVSDEDLYAKFGDPEKIAKELSEIEPQTKRPHNTNEDDHIYTFEPTGNPISISTKLVNEDVKYVCVDRPLIRVILEDAKNPDRYQITFENDILTISSQQKKTFGFNFSFRSSSGDFIVEIPKSLIIKEFKHQMINGDLSLLHLNSDIVNITSVEGDIHIENLTFKDGHIHTVNGDLNVFNTRGITLHINTVNGDLDFDHLDIEQDLTVDTVSGDIDAKNSMCETLYFHTVSGDTEGKEFYMKKLSFKSVSGDISLQNKNKDHIEILSKKTLSGDIDI